MKKSVLFVIIALVVVIIAGGYFALRKPQAPSFESSQITRGDIVQEIIVTGRVKPASEVSLAFEKSGRVEKVFVDVGDSVEEGDILVTLTRSDL